MQQSKDKFISENGAHTEGGNQEQWKPAGCGGSSRQSQERNSCRWAINKHRGPSGSSEPNETCAGTLFVSFQLRGDTTIQIDKAQKEGCVQTGIRVSHQKVVVSFPGKNLVDSSVPLQTLALVN